MKTTKAVIGILTTTIALSAQVQAQSFLTNGLVAYYPFNGNANDASGNGNDGTVNGAIFVADRFGVPASCIDFLPPQSVVIPNAPMLNLFTAFSVSGWLYGTNTASPAQDTQDLVCKGGNGVGGTQWIVRLINGQLVFWNGDGGAWTQYTVTNSISPNRWTHFAATFDEAIASVNMFLDGKLWLSTPILRHIQSSTDAGIPLVIGNNSVSSYGFYGMMDDVRIYNRALSTNEVQQVYAYESQPFVSLRKAVSPSFSNLFIGTNYQLQVSTDLKTWTNSGSAFTPTNTVMDYPQYFDVEDWGQLFFRVQATP
ncbi:MAG: LamG domain-containing protein [Limisphaerales bacterium]